MYIADLIFPTSNLFMSMTRAALRAARLVTKQQSFPKIVAIIPSIVAISAIS